MEHTTVATDSAFEPILDGLEVVGVALRSPQHLSKPPHMGTKQVQSISKTLRFDEAKEHIDALEDPYKLHGTLSPSRPGSSKLTIKRNGKHESGALSTLQTPPRANAANKTPSSSSKLAYPYSMARAASSTRAVLEECDIHDITARLESLRRKQLELEMPAPQPSGKSAKPTAQYGRVPKRPKERFRTQAEIMALIERTDRLLAEETFVQQPASDSDEGDDYSVIHTGSSLSQRTNRCKYINTCGLDFVPLFRETVQASPMSERPPSPPKRPPIRGTNRFILENTAPLDERYLHTIFAPSASPPTSSTSSSLISSTFPSPSRQPSLEPVYSHASTVVAEPLRPNACKCSGTAHKGPAAPCACQCFAWELRPLPKLVKQDPALVYAMADWSLRRLQLEEEDRTAV